MADARAAGGVAVSHASPEGRAPNALKDLSIFQNARQSKKIKNVFAIRFLLGLCAQAATTGDAAASLRNTAGDIATSVPLGAWTFQTANLKQAS